MAGQIRITPDQMRTRASEFRTEGQNFEDVINKMQNLIHTLQEEWESEASRKFAEQFDALRPSFVEVRNLIDHIGGQCDGTADALENLDREIASKFSV